MKVLNVFTILTLLGAGVIFTPLHAQNNTAREAQVQTSPENEAKQVANQLTKELRLSEDQQIKIYDINLKYLKNNPADQSAKGESKGNSAMSAMDAEIQKVLTEEQFRQYQELNEKRARRGDTVPTKSKPAKATQSRMGLE